MKIKLEDGHTYNARNGKIYKVKKSENIVPGDSIYCFKYDFPFDLTGTTSHKSWTIEGIYKIGEVSEYDLVEEVIEEKPSLTPYLDQVDGYIGKLREENAALKEENNSLKEKILYKGSRIMSQINARIEVEKENKIAKIIIDEYQNEIAMLKRHNA